MAKFTTEQETFWSEEFGDEYTGRNAGNLLLASNTALFAKILAHTYGIKSVIEFGSNIGMNLLAIRNLLPDVELSAIEINKRAHKILKEWGEVRHLYEESIIDFKPVHQWDFVLIKTVLIHINPEKLTTVYDNLYNSSRRYICVAEYYNPTPLTVTYRGQQDRLFKRDFAGEMLERFNDLRLIDYGFVYRHDPNYGSEYDDINWFLMEKMCE